MLEDFGIRRSISHGRKVRATIESSRKKLPNCFNCTPGEIILRQAVQKQNITLIVVASKHTDLSMQFPPIEMRHTLETLEKQGILNCITLRWMQRSCWPWPILKTCWKQYPNALISLMHANNEIGNLLNIKAVGDLAKQQYGSRFPIPFKRWGITATTCVNCMCVRHDSQAHKFHGPKGVGFMYIRKDRKLGQFIHGGAQERNMRGGTENTLRRSWVLQRHWRSRIAKWMSISNTSPASRHAWLKS